MSKSKGVIYSHLSLILVNIIYGASYIVAKGIMPDIVGPSGFILIRIIGATLLFWMLFPLFKEIPEKKDLYKFLIAGVFGVACNQLFFFNGLSSTSALNASIIMTSTPILVLVISFIYGTEKLNSKKITGMVLGLAGALVLIQSSANDNNNITSWKGDLMIFINALSYSIYLVYVRPLMKKYKPITVITWVFTFGLIMVLPFGWGQMQAVDIPSLSYRDILSICFVVLFTTFLTYLLSVSALKTLKSSVASTYIYLQPVIALVFSIIFYYYHIYDNVKPTITITKVICTITIFVGVYLVTMGSKKS